jgi:hypothetical protein
MAKALFQMGQITAQSLKYFDKAIWEILIAQVCYMKADQQNGSNLIWSLNAKLLFKKSNQAQAGPELLLLKQGI